MIRLLKHKYSFGRKKLRNNEDIEMNIYIGVSEEFNEQMKNRFNHDHRIAGTELGYIYYNHSQTVIWTTVKCTLEKFENSVFRNIAIDNNVCANTAPLFRRLANFRENVVSHERTLEDKRYYFIKAYEDLENSRSQYEMFKSKLNVLKKVPFNSNGNIEFTFENVVAEDTDAEGEDIELGTLVFEVTLGGSVDIIQGDFPHPTEYNDNAYHPHHLSGNVCMGTAGPDLIQAISDFDIDTARAIVYGFAHRYTSSDSAGKYWRRWAGLDMDDHEGQYYVPSRDEWYDEEDCAWSDNREEWLHQDDCVYIDSRNDYYLTGDLVYLEYKAEYYHPEDTVWSERDQETYHEDDVVDTREGYIFSEDAVELHNGEWLHLEEAVEYEGQYYDRLDCVVIDGEQIPEQYTVWSDSLQQHLLKTDATQQENGDWVLLTLETQD